MAASSGTDAKWYERDATPGYVLLGAAALSFILMNFVHDAFDALLHFRMEANILGYPFSYDVKKFVKDALMAVFFLFVGLELKREVMEGPFKNPKEAALPIMGAIGGMAAPAIVYMLVATFLNPAGYEDLQRGWAIPTATDIAFAVGVLSLLGARIPAGLRLFLLALAIVDDLGAILIIALFYSSNIAFGASVAAALIFLAMMALNWRGVKNLAWYWALGLALWLAMAQTGVSPTLAGVLTAMAIPMRHGERSPLIAAEHALKLPVQLGIMPLFALVVAGVPLAGQSLDSLWHPVTLGVALGLVIGKPLGIATMTMVGSRIFKQPPPCGIPGLIGVSLVAGIGFTMSLFVGALAFPTHPEFEAPVRFGVLGGSAIAATMGLLILSRVYPGRAPEKHTELAREEELAERRGVLEDQD